MITFIYDGGGGGGNVPYWVQGVECSYSTLDSMAMFYKMGSNNVWLHYAIVINQLLVRAISLRLV